MTKKHIVEIGYMKYAFDSIKAATDLITLINKAIPVDYEFDHPARGYKPAAGGREMDIELKLNQVFHPAHKPKAEKPAKHLALPAPKRGTILCVCEKSYVAPKQNCPHCGLHFNVSHGRTHEKSEQLESQPKLRLV